MKALKITLLDERRVMIQHVGIEKKEIAPEKQIAFETGTYVRCSASCYYISNELMYGTAGKLTSR